MTTTLLQIMEWKLNLESAKEDISELLDDIDKSADLLINFNLGYIRLKVKNVDETYKTIPALIAGLQLHTNKGKTNVHMS